VLLGCATFLVAATWGAANSPLFDVDRITVSGADHVAAAAVRAASGVDDGTPLVAVDVSASERAIARLPWVESADVRRKWPGTMIIEITERVAVAVAPAAGGGWAVLDAAGRVLEVAAAEEGKAPELPVLEGVRPGAAGAVIDDEVGTLRVLARLPDEVGRTVRAVAADGREVVLRLEGGGEIRFGDAAHIDEKVLALATVFDKVDLASLARLDVSIPGSPVLTRR
jgi:cell division protein FtsQ